MTAHEHDETHDDHGGHHDEPWGDYNAQPEGKNNLPRISRAALLFFGLALLALLGAITCFSLKFQQRPRASHAAPQGEENHTSGQAGAGHGEG